MPCVCLPCVLVSKGKDTALSLTRTNVSDRFFSRASFTDIRYIAVLLALLCNLAQILKDMCFRPSLQYCSGITVLSIEVNVTQLPSYLGLLSLLTFIMCFFFRLSESVNCEMKPLSLPPQLITRLGVGWIQVNIARDTKATRRKFPSWKSSCRLVGSLNTATRAKSNQASAQ